MENNVIYEDRQPVFMAFEYNHILDKLVKVLSKNMEIFILKE